MPSSDTQFKKGHSGRPKGARNKFSEDYVEAFATDFEEHGAEVFARVRIEQPGVYLKLAAMLVPKDFNLKHSGDVTVQLVNYADIDEQADNDEQADSERIASNGSVPISLVG